VTMTQASQTPDRTLLPEGFADWIEVETGGALVAIEPHAGAGVSREGCFVTIERGGERIEAYLAYDVRRADDPSRQDFCRREASALAVAAERGLRAPEPLGRWPEQRAILTRKLPGRVETDHLDEDRKIALARDYMVEIARLHRLDVSGLDLDGFGPPPADARDYARERVAFLRERHKRFGADDPLNILMYRWLDENLPADRVPAAIVHGDVGPANFLHDDDRVTAVLDWEQTHYGDPMEDFGWLLLRSALFPFLPLPPLVKAWEEEYGAPIDVPRVHYYRLLAQAGVLTDQCGQLVQSDGPMLGNTGRVFTFYLGIRSLSIAALAEACGVALEPIEPPEPVPGMWNRLHILARAEVDERIAPRTLDRNAAARADALNPLIHFWEGREHYGAALDERERAAIGAALSRDLPDVAAARAALAAAIEDGSISIPDAVRLCHLRSAGEILCGAPGLGRFASIAYPPLVQE